MTTHKKRWIAQMSFSFTELYGTAYGSELQEAVASLLRVCWAEAVKTGGEGGRGPSGDEPLGAPGQSQEIPPEKLPALLSPGDQVRFSRPRSPHL